MSTHPQAAGPRPPFSSATQENPGEEFRMHPRPDYGETSYVGAGKLKGKKALITGGDSGIGRAVALAYAREGADVMISYLNEEKDAAETKAVVEKEGRRCVTMAGDLADEQHCRELIRRAVAELGGLDILVNNAAFQQSRDDLSEIPSEEFDRTFRVNVYAMFYLCQEALPHMKKGGAIINTTSINADTPKQQLIPYSATKAAIQNFTGSLAQAVADKGIRVNCVAPGPVWTPLIVSTMPAEQVKTFGKDVPMKRPGQPVEMAPLYVMLASDEASYVSGATIAATGGEPLI